MHKLHISWVFSAGTVEQLASAQKVTWKDLMLRDAN